MSKSELTIMDGAIGTVLLSHGVPLNSCLEEVNLSQPELILKIHQSYIEAGAEVIVTNTFGANRLRLSSHARGHQAVPHLEKINREGVRIAKEAAGKLPVFASIGPLGRETEKMSSKEMRGHFREQAEALEREKPAGFLIETMASLKEAEAATSAVREVSDRPLISLMTFPKGVPGEESVKVIAETLRRSGANRIGANCGGKRGPEEVYSFIESLSQVDPGPFCARPAAGLPDSLMRPEEFAQWGLKLKEIGCSWIGGCCGTNPDYIRALREVIR